tara:strand:+ start:105570 stop:106406 length:837 start_codon:yes stop_codon:yes gene_type:complete
MDEQPNIDHEQPTPIGEEYPSAQADRDLFGKAPRKHTDWSHRRGEPRVLTLLWMMYLMAAVVLMFSSMATAYSISPSITRPAARTMLVMVVLGLCVLWPMIRFSQRPDYLRTHGHTHFAFRDGFVLFVPMQAVIWPQALAVLADWPILVIAGISVLCLGWTLIIAGVVALGTSSIERNNGSGSMRVLWMLILILVVFGAPIVGGLGSFGYVGVEQARVGWLLSPITGVLEIVRDRAQLGTSTRLFSEHWRMMIALICVGTALLLIARASEVAQARYRA